jgi:hypothetical protein
MNFLFAIDTNTKEIIISDSRKGTNKIDFIERISLHDNEILYKAVELLTNISRASNIDATLFKAMDKVCQIVYIKHKENK